MSEWLIIFGFTWILVSGLIGLSVAHRHEPHLVNLETLACKGDLLNYHRALDAYKWRVTVHAHGMLFSMISIVAGLVIPRLAYPQLIADGLAILFISATVGWTLAAFKSRKVIMGLSDLAFLIAIVTVIVGLARDCFL